MAPAEVGWKYATQPAPPRASSAPPAAFFKVPPPVAVRYAGQDGRFLGSAPFEFFEGISSPVVVGAAFGVRAG